jgi:hypothetical protein
MRRTLYQLRPSTALIGLLSLILASAPAAAQDKPVTAEPNPVAGAVKQPFKDLGIVKDKLPDPLKNADAAPYDLTAQNDCAAIEAEITQFDKLLGPDVDTPEERAAGKKQKNLLSGALGKTVGLPFRSVLRAITGAERNDQKKREAIEAGMARRSYLKGVAHGKGCGMPAPQVAQTPAPGPANAAVDLSQAPPLLPERPEALAETAPPLIP